MPLPPQCEGEGPAASNMIISEHLTRRDHAVSEKLADMRFVHERGASRGSDIARLILTLGEERMG